MIDVVIPVYNTGERIDACLAALSEEDLPHRVIVADDCSTDGSADRIAAVHPGVTLVRADQNRGFAGNANSGLRAATADVTVLLNDDVVIRPGFLRALAEPFSDPSVGMTAAVMLRPDGSLEGIGMETDLTFAAFSRFWGHAESDIPGLPADEPTLVGPSGGAAGYRTKALQQVGFFDERMHSYSEDLDLALRLRAAGWRCVEARRAVCTHEGGQSMGRRSERQLWSKGHSRTYLLRKYGVLSSPRAVAETLAAELPTVAFQLLRDRSAAGLRGRVAGWRDGASVTRVTVPDELVNTGIGPRDAWRRRRSYV